MVSRPVPERFQTRLVSTVSNWLVNCRNTKLAPRASPATTSRSAPAVYSQVLGMESLRRHSWPLTSIPDGPQSSPMVAELAPPEKAQFLSYAWLASFHWQRWLTWLPRVCPAMPLTSASRYSLKLARRTVRPSWVASQAVARLGVTALSLKTWSPRLLLALAVVKATPGVTVRNRVGRPPSLRVTALRRELVSVMNQP